MKEAAANYTTSSNGTQNKPNEPELTLEEWYQLMQEDRFNSKHNIEEPDWVVSIQGFGVSKAGDITSYVGQSKAGKSGVNQALIAGSMAIPGDIIDTCGITVKPNRNRKALIHIDTEQSRYDFHGAMMKTIYRASKKSEPDWLESYNWDTYDEAEKIQRFEKLCEYANLKHGGIYMIIVDGIADFVASVNDEAESKRVVMLFRGIAKKYDCPVVVILHFNPSQKKGEEKGRGHIGSFLERKSGSYLAIRKDPDTEISTIESIHMRKAGKLPVIQFHYDVEKGYHVYHGVQIQKTKDEAKEEKLAKKRQDLKKLAIDIFGQNKLRRVNAANAIAAVLNMSEETAFNRIKEMKQEGLLIQDFDGLYSLNPEILIEV